MSPTLPKVPAMLSHTTAPHRRRCRRARNRCPHYVDRGASLAQAARVFASGRAAAGSVSTADGDVRFRALSFTPRLDGPAAGQGGSGRSSAWTGSSTWRWNSSDLTAAQKTIKSRAPAERGHPRHARRPLRRQSPTPGPVQPPLRPERKQGTRISIWCRSPTQGESGLNRDEMPHWQDSCLTPEPPRWSQSGKLLTSPPFSA